MEINMFSDLTTVILLGGIFLTILSCLPDFDIDKIDN